VAKGAVIYVRVSTAEQASSNQSLPVQESRAKDLCQQRGLAVLKLFADKGESARTDDRPEFKKMMAYCRQHKQEISHVIVSDLSRLARNVVDQGNTIVELGQMGIQLVSVDEPNLDNSAGGRLLKNVLGSLNQFFSDSLSEKTKVRMAAGVKQGRWLWVAPLGYRNSTDTKTVIIDQERGPLVRKVFELMAEGASVGDAMRQVTALGLTTRKGRKIPSQTFSRLIRNPFYCGWIENNGNRIKGNHEPLVSEDVFNAVQKRLNPSVPHVIEHDDFPLRGFVRCYKCGKNLTSGRSHGRKKKYARYWCWTRGCGAVGVSSDELEFRFLNLLYVIQPQAYVLARLPSIAAKSWSNRKERIAADSKALTRLLDDQRTLHQKAVKAKLLGELSEEDFRAVKTSIETETSRLQSQVKALDTEVCTMEELVKQTDAEVINFGKSWKAAPVRRKREIQSALFPKGLAFDPKIFWFCTANPSLMQSFNNMVEDLFSDGVPGGI